MLRLLDCLKFGDHRALIALIALAMFGGTTIAKAAEIPDFLSSGQVYASDAAVCEELKTVDVPTAGLMLDSIGVNGPEYECVFADYTPVRKGGQGETITVLARASCGGGDFIRTADTFDLSKVENGVQITSQNDYLAALTKDIGNDQSSGVVDQTFIACE